MAIRIRIVDGAPVALCAAETDPRWDDIYLHDGIHHALTVKFESDLYSMGFISSPPADSEQLALMESQKVHDAVESLRAWLVEQEKDRIFEGFV